MQAFCHADLAARTRGLVECGAEPFGELQRVVIGPEMQEVLKLIANGLEITAVHNHLLRANPATFYMHVGGHGDPLKMAGVIHDALAASKTPLTVAAAGPAPAVELDTAQLDKIVGVNGQNNGGVYAFAVPRRDQVNEGGMQ